MRQERFRYTDNGDNILVREWWCQDCNHIYLAPVEISYTANLSGEVTQQCPVCNSRNLDGSITFHMSVSQDLLNNAICNRL
jgi:hypothetical protein